jgi:biopolymer transport protein ExbD
VLEKLTYSELTYVFMHELGHLKRHDIGVSWVVTLLQVFQWFNPFVWLAFYQMRIDQESACDASVLKRLKLDQSKDYAVSILGFLEKFCQNRQVSAMAGIMENKSQIKRRIAMILKHKKYSKKITATSIVMLFIAGFIFFTLTGYATEEQSNITGREFNRPTIQQWPQHKPGDKFDESRIIIIITKEGEISIDFKKVDIASMVSRMERFHKEYPDGFVLIAGYNDTPLGRTIEVLDKVKMTGVKNVSVATVKE